MAKFSFDTSSVQSVATSYELLPAGWYTAQVTDSEIRPLNTGNGQGMKLTFTILSDNYRGRKVWTQLNVRHTNPKSEDIGLKQLKKLCQSIGLARVEDTVELHNKPVDILLKIRQSEDGRFSDQNDVVGYKPAAGGQALTPTLPAATVAAPAANAAAVPPWAKRAA